MKKICLYLLVIFIATYNTGVYEFARLPAFFRHYAEHTRRDKAISFSDFIGMHYLGHDINDNDDKKDAELPFKNYHTATHPQLLFVPVHQAIFSFMAFADEISPTPYHPEFLAKNITAIQLRPPCC